MDIHEYQAKEIFRKFGIAVPNGMPIFDSSKVPDAISMLKGDKLMVKAQVHAGGRGKAGGAKLCNREHVQSTVESMMFTRLVTHQTSPEGQVVSRTYVEEASNIDKEFYLSAVLDRKLSCVTLVASAEGGVDIEEVADKNPNAIVTVAVDPTTGFQSFHGRLLSFGIGLKPEDASLFIKIASAIYEICIQTDALQVEINPLVRTKEGFFVALDAKISFDDNALYRQKEIQLLRDKTEEQELEIEAASHGLSYIKMDGKIGCMVNGAGLAMATMDIIQHYGSSPANFLDVGGGASLEAVTSAFKIISSDTNVKGILVNIFGGIMKCDIIADGIVKASKEVGIKVPIVVRLSGTNYELGKEILENSGLNLEIADELGEAARKIVNMVKD